MGYFSKLSFIIWNMQSQRHSPFFKQWYNKEPCYKKNPHQEYLAENHSFILLLRCAYSLRSSLQPKSVLEYPDWIQIKFITSEEQKWHIYIHKMCFCKSDPDRLWECFEIQLQMGFQWRLSVWMLSSWNQISESLFAWKKHTNGIKYKVLEMLNRIHAATSSMLVRPTWRAAVHLQKLNRLAAAPQLDSATALFCGSALWNCITSM